MNRRSLSYLKLSSQKLSFSCIHYTCTCRPLNFKIVYVYIHVCTCKGISLSTSIIIIINVCTLDARVHVYESVLGAHVHTTVHTLGARAHFNLGTCSTNQLHVYTWHKKWHVSFSLTHTQYTYTHSHSTEDPDRQGWYKAGTDCMCRCNVSLSPNKHNVDC